MDSKNGTPTARNDRDEHENLAAGDDAMEDDLTQEGAITPEAREDVAQTLHMDP